MQKINKCNNDKLENRKVPLGKGKPNENQSCQSLSNCLITTLRNGDVAGLGERGLNVNEESCH